MTKRHGTTAWYKLYAPQSAKGAMNAAAEALMARNLSETEHVSPLEDCRKAHECIEKSLKAISLHYNLHYKKNPRRTHDIEELVNAMKAGKIPYPKEAYTARKLSRFAGSGSYMMSRSDVTDEEAEYALDWAEATYEQAEAVVFTPQEVEERERIRAKQAQQREERIARRESAELRRERERRRALENRLKTLEDAAGGGDGNRTADARTREKPHKGSVTSRQRMA